MKYFVMCGLVFSKLLSANSIETYRDTFKNTVLNAMSVESTGAAVKYNPNSELAFAGCGSGTKCAQNLFVMLPGTGGKPTDFKKIIRAMAASGMAAIGLDYQSSANNSDGFTDAAGCRDNDKCFDEFRSARVLGVENSPYVLSKEDGILNRLVKALQKLGWKNFYEKDHLLYDKIVFAGYSQGAGMAAWIGKHYQVRRVVQFSGTSDSTRQGKKWVAASWTKEEGKTWTEDIYVFFSPKDESYQRDKVVWDAMGMFNSPAAWDSLEGNKLFTLFPSANAACSVVCDAATPTNPDGSPTFLETWAYLGNPTFTPKVRQITKKQK